MQAADADFFVRLTRPQSPRFLWIGCSDSRVPAEQITGQAPGSLFVHRNIANQFLRHDMNAHAVLQYGISMLGIADIIVCGHYGCTGIQSALKAGPRGPVNDWLLHIRQIQERHRLELESLPDGEPRFDRLAELNVLHQQAHIASSTAVQEAWRSGRSVTVHGWIYALADGRIRDLGSPLCNNDDHATLCKMLGLPF